MTSSLPLPPFDRDHVDEMLAALDAGDPRRAEQIRQHLVAEGTTDSDEAAMLESVSRASVLARQMVAARDAGDDAEADRLQSQLHNGFDPDTLGVVLGGMLATVGRQQGWLPEREYDQLLSLIGVTGPELTAMVGQIRRGRPADD